MQQIQKNTFYMFDPVLRTQATQNLFWILRPFCRFRTYLVLLPKAKKEYKYNAGHTCTYKQILYGRMNTPFIECSAVRQYGFLVEQVEAEYLKTSIAATIWGRTITKDYIEEMCALLAKSHQPAALNRIIELDKQNGFDIMCRNYVKGQLLDAQDPVLTPDSDIKLWYDFNDGRLVLTPQSQAVEILSTDFSSLVSQQLETVTP